MNKRLIYKSLCDILHKTAAKVADFGMGIRSGALSHFYAKVCAPDFVLKNRETRFSLVELGQKV